MFLVLRMHTAEQEKVRSSWVNFQTDCVALISVNNSLQQLTLQLHMQAKPFADEDVC